MQLFGLTFQRDPSKCERLSQDEEAKRAERVEQRRLALRDKATYMVELEEGEELDTVESKQPSSEYQEYNKLMIMVALKSLGLCYSMFDEKHTNFYGIRAAIIQYLELCKPRRESNQYLLESLI